MARNVSAERLMRKPWPSGSSGVSPWRLAFGLQAGGYTPTELTTEAAVTGAGRQRLEGIAEAQFV